MGKKAAVLFAPGFEEIETVTIIDVLRRAGIEVVAAGTEAGPLQGSHGIPIVPDALVATVKAADFDAVVLPGGMPNARSLAVDPECQRVIREAREQGRVVGAICAAPIALLPGDLIQDQGFTSHPAVKEELPAAGYRNERVVRDGNLVTSRGPGTSLEFALELVAMLVGEDKRNQVAAPMFVPENS